MRVKISCASVTGCARLARTFPGLRYNFLPREHLEVEPMAGTGPKNPTSKARKLKFHRLFKNIQSLLSNRFSMLFVDTFVDSELLRILILNGGACRNSSASDHGDGTKLARKDC